MGMKVVFVDNPHSEASRVAREAFLKRWTTEGQAQEFLARLNKGEPMVAGPAEWLIAEAEVYVVDFHQLRNALPIRAAPCVFICFGDLEETFVVEDVEETAMLVQEAFVAKRQGRSVVVADDTGDETIRGRRVFGPPMEPSAEGQ